MSRPRTPPAQITEAIRRAGGNVSAAAALLCLEPSTVRRRLCEAPHLWPAEVSRERPRATTARAPRVPAPPTFDAAAMLRAIREAGGSVAAAARALGISRQGLHDRLSRHRLWPEGVPRERRASAWQSESV